MYVYNVHADTHTHKNIQALSFNAGWPKSFKFLLRQNSH